MSSFYVLPIDPTTPQSNVTGIDASKLWNSVPKTSENKPAKVGKTHIFYGEKPVALSSLGDKFSAKKDAAKREVVRKAVGSAVKSVKSAVGEAEVLVDASADPHAAAVAAHLASFSFSLKTSSPSRFHPDNKEEVPEKFTFKPLEDSEGWRTGALYAYCQNLARELMELPANLMTPTLFTERIQAELAGVENVEVIVRDAAWAKAKGMNTFLSVSKGTTEPPKFLEIHYKGDPSAQSKPLAFVGKGVTFDSGGISIKPSADMKLMRGDMGGAAAVASAAVGIAKLKLPVNLSVFTPLTENMPGPSANKPGDVIYAMNGKTVEVDNTDAEGRLILSDALWYASHEFKPHTLIDVATLTGAMDIALGELYSGVFTNSTSLYDELHTAGEHEHDRFWRMPLDEGYREQIDGSNADLCNIGGRPAGSCTAALFLKDFVEGVNPVTEDDEPAIRWAHLDIAGTMEATRPTPYLGKGMTGSSTRALIEFAKRFSQS